MQRNLCFINCYNIISELFLEFSVMKMNELHYLLQNNIINNYWNDL